VGGLSTVNGIFGKVLLLLLRDCSDQSLKESSTLHSQVLIVILGVFPNCKNYKRTAAQ